MAQCCFTPDGRINLDYVRKLRNFWAFVVLDPYLKKYHTIPGIELVREQTLTVLEKLAQNSGQLLDILSRACGKIPNSNVEPLLENMGIWYAVNDAIPQTILQSLFMPHRQTCLPTCSINALINAEIFNHPERLADIYTQILTSLPGSIINLPIGRTKINLRPIAVGQVR
ncbi:MAG: hypothetical protein LBB16_02900 [Puniceicoccales bacterium]|nr:hypothetical protein [Puniceicoccales bacterium]